MRRLLKLIGIIGILFSLSFSVLWIVTRPSDIKESIANKDQEKQQTKPVSPSNSSEESLKENISAKDDNQDIDLNNESLPVIDVKGIHIGMTKQELDEKLHSLKIL